MSPEPSGLVHRPRGTRGALFGLLLFASYVVAGKLGLSIAVVHPSASAVWAPTGIALAAVLLAGAGVWPAILLGAFVVNVTTAGSPPISATIAAGNTLEALLGAGLVHRFASGPRVFERAPDAFRYVIYAGMIATTVSATVGVTTLAVAGSAPWTQYAPIWITWWLGDVAGALVVGPAIVLWAQRPRPGYDVRASGELALLVVVALVTSLVVFGGGLDLLGLARYPLGFLILPPLLWASFRFGPREAATLLTLVALVATWGTLTGVSAFATGRPHEVLVLLQAFMATIAGITLPTAAVVAERRRAQQHLLESEAAYRAMFEGNPHPLWVMDPHTLRFLAVNDAALVHYGYSRGEFLAMTAADIRPPDEMPALDSARETLRAHERYTGAHRHRTRDGTIIDVEVTAHLVRFGGREAALIRANDVTERIRAGEREHQALAAAEQANRAKDEFLATLSHELRTPLTAMLGWIVLLREGGLDPAAARRALETVERNTRLQARLIEDLLDVSRIVADKLVLELRPMALATAVEAAVDAVRPIAHGKSIAIDVRVGPAVPTVLGDPARVQQIAWNLLSNAVKFTPAGGRVTVEVGARGSRALFRVIDTGRGIPPAFLPHIFDRFRQAEASTTRAHGGLGLGLTIVRHLVTLHGGTLDVTSDGVGRGATFTVELPAAEASATEPAGVAPLRARARLSGMTVLVVDDDADSRGLIGAMLERAGAAATQAGSVAEAKAAMSRGRFRAVVADIAMPGEDGYAFIRHVRGTSAYATLPAVALTGFARHEDRERALAAGYDAHVTKPVEPDALVDAVETVVSRRQAG